MPHRSAHSGDVPPDVDSGVQRPGPNKRQGPVAPTAARRAVRSSTVPGGAGSLRQWY